MSRKLQEKQARREAEAKRRKEQQRAARRRNLVTVGIALVVAVVVVGLIYMEQRGGSAVDTVAASQANCGDIEEFESEGRGHVPDGTQVVYETSPPTSGQHWDVPANTGFYPPESIGDPPPQRLVHNMEHGQIVLWYSPDAPEDVIDTIEDYVEGQSGQQTLALLAAPWDGIPAGRNFAMTAWTASQSCEQLSAGVVDGFRERFQGRGPEQVGVPTFTAEG